MIQKCIAPILLLLSLGICQAQTTIPLENYFRDLQSIEVEIEGQSYRFLFDTGGGITLVSPEIAQKTNKPIYGTYVGYRMSGEAISFPLLDSLCMNINHKLFVHDQVGVFDVMALLPKDFKRIDGVISLKTFQDYPLSLHLKEQKIILETEASYKAKKKVMEVIPARFANGLHGLGLTIFLGTPIKDRFGWFLMDSGNIAATKISKNMAREIGIPDTEKDPFGERSFQFRLAGESFSTPVILDAIIYDGAFSFDLLKQSEYLISFSEKKVWGKKMEP